MAAATTPPQPETLEYLEKGLALYYDNLNVPYYNNDNVGKFAEMMDENGFEKGDLGEELNGDVDECSFLEFDDNFPFKIMPDPDKREKEIFEIVKHCYKHGIPPASLKTAMDIDLDPKKLTKATKSVADMYAKQTPLIYDVISKEVDLLMFLSAASINGSYPFLSSIIDAYTRDRVISKWNDKEPPSAVQWTNKTDFTYQLKGKKVDGNDNMMIKLSNGIKGYLNRISPVFAFASLIEIDDDIQKISNYIVSTSDFINSLVNAATPTANVPFQVDLTIAVEKVTSAQDISNNVDTNDDDDDDNNDDDDNDVDDMGGFNLDYVGNLEEKLNSSSLDFHVQDIDQTKDIDGLTRAMMDNFDKFKAKLKKKAKKKKQFPHIPQHKPFNSSTYPTKKRFCLFIDRTIVDKDDDNINRMTFFEPPPICDTVPDNNVPEWYFESIRTCLIPKKGFGDDLKNNNDDDDDDNKAQPVQTRTITSQSGCSGKILTFSFHVVASDQIKCYMYWMGQSMRFYPQDIVQVFKHIFAKQRYDDFTNDKNEVNGIISRILIKDAEFEAFYRSLDSNNNKQFPKFTFT